VDFPRSPPLFVIRAWCMEAKGCGIGCDGVLTSVTGSPFVAGSQPHTIVVEPTGQFVYVANEGFSVSAYAIGSDGALTSIPGLTLPSDTIPYSVAVDSTGRFAYVTDHSGQHSFGLQYQLEWCSDTRPWLALCNGKHTHRPDCLRKNEAVIFELGGLSVVELCAKYFAT
jgi:hypothetical protein